MSDWANYRLEDFVPFTAEVYLRLLERMGETFWPLHLPTLTIGVAALLLALNDRSRLACLLIAPLWTFVGIAFLLQRYAELNWAGGYLGWAFLVQSAVLLAMAVTGLGADKAKSAGRVATGIGLPLALMGLVVYPLIAVLAGQPWQQAETFGIHPDPTAVVTLGLGLIGVRRNILWLVTIIPAVWLIVSTLTLRALDLPWAFVPLLVLLISLVGLAWKTLIGTRTGSGLQSSHD